MCTVTFIKTNSAVFITSNRDENRRREKAIAPQTQIWNNTKIVFPRDSAAGGTWFAVNDKGRVIVLLNGAEKKHEPIYPYRKSRGLILLDLMKEENSLEGFNDINLENIEPFTIILFQNERLSQLRWNGEQKVNQELNANLPHIWSSATLYSEEIILQRSKSFQHFLKNNMSPNAEQIIAFHKTNNGDLQNGFLMKRENGVLTQSITQAILSKEDNRLYYYDLLQNEELDPFSITHKNSIVEPG